MTVAMPMTEWQQLGVELPNGRPLPADAPDAALVSGSSRHFLVHHNYDALLDYNCAHAYALAVGLLSGQIESSSPIRAERRSTAAKKGGQKAKARRKAR